MSKSPVENLRTPSKRWPWIAGGIGAVLAIAAAFTVPSLIPATPEPAPTEQVGEEATPEPTVTPTPTPTPEPVVEPAPAPVVEAPAPPPPAAPAPPAPVTCPAGSITMENDGTNDTWCMWDYCANLTLPSEEHPECYPYFRP